MLIFGGQVLFINNVIFGQKFLGDVIAKDGRFNNDDVIKMPMVV